MSVDEIAVMPGFKATAGPINETLSARLERIRERVTAMKKVRSYPRTLWKVLERRASLPGRQKVGVVGQAKALS